MELLGIISVVCNILALLCTGATAAFFVVIKFNDLTHLDKAVTEIKETLKKMDEKGDSTAERIAKLEGKCKANHG